LVALALNCGDSLGPTYDSSLFEEPEGPVLRTTRTAWHLAAKPAPLGADYIRGKILWHTPRELVSVDDVWDCDAAQGQGTLRTFRMIFRPRHFRADTAIVGDQLDVDTTATGLKSWAGITAYLGEWGYYIHDTTQFFEIRAQAGSGKMHIEFGRINEDIDGDDMLDTEDGIASGGARNGVCEPEEDVGLDGLADPDESEFYEYIKDVTTDPAGDNWYFLNDGKCPLPGNQCDRIDWDDETIRYEWLNGTEGNIDDPSVQGRPDEEMLTRMGFNTSNSYFSYVIDFESDSSRVPDSDWPPDVARERRWWTYRIPFRDTSVMDEIVDADGSPNWAQITHARIWFEDETGDNTTWDTVQIAEWGFLQRGIGPGPQPDSSMSFIRDYEFAYGRVFDLAYPGDLEPEDSIIRLTVYEQVHGPDTAEARLAMLVVDPADPQAYPAESMRAVYVKEVEPSTYTWLNGPGRFRHCVVFSRERGRSVGLGAFLSIKRHVEQDTINVGYFSHSVHGARLWLRTLRHHSPENTHQSWQLMWRNCYSIPKGMRLGDLNISVLKGVVGAEHTTNALPYQELLGLTQSYLEILGLDQYDQTGRKHPDGQVDDRNEVYRPEWGLLIFPEREPFNSTRTFINASGNETMPLQDTVPEIYQVISSHQLEGASRYFIRTVSYPPLWPH
jgi:hypothetical protein